MRRQLISLLGLLFTSPVLAADAGTLRFSWHFHGHVVDAEIAVLMYC